MTDESLRSVQIEQTGAGIYPGRGGVIARGTGGDDTPMSTFETGRPA